MVKPKLISFEIRWDKTRDSFTELSCLDKKHSAKEAVSVDEWQLAGVPASKKLLGKYGVEKYLPLIVGRINIDKEELRGKFESEDQLRQYINYYWPNNDELNRGQKERLLVSAQILFKNNIVPEEVDDVVRLMNSNWEERIKGGERIEGESNWAYHEVVEITLESSGRKILCSRGKRGPSDPIREFFIFK